MLFDKLCKAEARATDEQAILGRALLREAKLIAYTPEANAWRRSRVGNRTLIGQEAREFVEGFFLPFAVCAVEDEDGVVVLWKMDALAGPMAAPLLKRGGMTNATTFYAINFRRERGEFFYVATAVHLGLKQEADGLKTILGVTGAIYLRMLDHRLNPIGTKMLTHAEGPQTELLARNNTQDVWVALFELAYFNSPDVLVVSARPSTAPPLEKRSDDYIPRAHERTRYMAIPREKVLRILGVSEEDEAATRELLKGHPRRAHWRELRAERYVNKQGQRIKVRETWVGPEEAERSGVRYRVHLGTAEELRNQA